MVTANRRRYHARVIARPVTASLPLHLKRIFAALALLAALSLIYGSAVYAAIPGTDPKSLPEPTHTSFESLPWVYLPLDGHPQQVELNAKSPAFAFDEGPSYFLAYRVPAASSPDQQRRIVVVTRTIGMLMPTAYAFYPQLTFLNERFEIIGKIAPEWVHHLDWISTKNAGWAGALDIPSDVAYVLVHCPADKRGTPMYLRADHGVPNQIVTAGGVPISTKAAGFRWQIWIPASGLGRVQLTATERPKDTDPVTDTNLAQYIFRRATHAEAAATTAGTADAAPPEPSTPGGPAIGAAASSPTH